MVFIKLLLQNTLAIGPYNYGAASKPLLPKLARCIPVLSYALRVLVIKKIVVKGAPQPLNSLKSP